MKEKIIMKLKEILKPNKWKGSLFLLVSLILFNMSWIVPVNCEFCVDLQGIPVPVYYSSGFELPKTFFPLGFLIDIFFWYYISCFTVWIYDEYKNE